MKKVEIFLRNSTNLKDNLRRGSPHTVKGKNILLKIEFT